MAKRRYKKSDIDVDDTAQVPILDESELIPDFPLKKEKNCPSCKVLNNIKHVPVHQRQKPVAIEEPSSEPVEEKVEDSDGKEESDES